MKPITFAGCLHTSGIRDFLDSHAAFVPVPREYRVLSRLAIENPAVADGHAVR
jgi:hypothetical protein